MSPSATARRCFCTLQRNKRFDYEKKLWRLSKKGEIDKGFEILHAMRSEKIEITHYALSSMLHCCINNKDGKNTKNYEKIWNDLVIDEGVKADIGCYCLLIKAASFESDLDQTQKWIKETKNLFFCDLNTRKWNAFISALCRCDGFISAFDEYKAMKVANILPDSFTFSILINAAINTNDFERFDILLNDVLNQQIFHKLDVFAVSAVFDGLIRSGNAFKVEEIRKKYKFETNILCFSWFLMAAVHCNDFEAMNEILRELKEQRSDLRIDLFALRNIMSALGHFKEFDRMWAEYFAFYGENEAVERDIRTLSILCTFEERKSHQIKALNEVMKYVSDWTQIANKRKKHFYRVACIAEHTEMQSILWPYLEKNEDFIQVYAKTEINSQQFVFDNSPKQNEENEIDNLTNDLIESVMHKICTTKHPEIRSLDEESYVLTDEYAQKMVSMHAEKRALAFLIHENVQNIKIEVSMRMCSDCHRFFCCVSQKYAQKTIICIDPNKRHIFKNGHCSCGKG